MLFETEEDRILYHKSNTVLQTIVQIFEDHCYLYHKQVQFIGLLNDAQALVGIADIDPEVMTEIEDKMNRQFSRKDPFVTCMVDNLDLGTFILYARHTHDFVQLA